MSRGELVVVIVATLPFVWIIAVSYLHRPELADKAPTEADLTPPFGTHRPAGPGPAQGAPRSHVRLVIPPNDAP